MKSFWSTTCVLVFMLAANPSPGMAEDTSFAGGVTVDLLPTLVSASAGAAGGAAQVWGAQGHWKGRLIGASLMMPDEMDGSDAFDNKRLRVAAILVDYTFGPDHDGLWIGAGVERWFTSIEHKNTGHTLDGQETALTVGAGYIWYLGSIEVNPWFAVHQVIEPMDKTLAGDRYNPNPLSAEVSLKLGWRLW